MAEAELARFRAQQADQFRNILRFYGRMHREHEWEDTNAPNRGEIAQRIIGQAAIERRIDRLGGAGGEEEAVAIGPGARRRDRADIAIGAAAIFDHHRLA